ncbi:transmembrane protein 65 isoform X2 [Armigeres subalbatus]|uniref:transmembrane protein 65 isoform X2 n=1 Tax=Armigeres subalbatus TaxID=124917 RepID=UPI002ED592A0
MNASVSCLMRSSSSVLGQYVRVTTGIVVPVQTGASGLPCGMERQQEASQNRKFSSMSGERGGNPMKNTCRITHCRRGSINGYSEMPFLKAVMRFDVTRGYTQAASTLTREQLHDLVYRLNEDERELLMNTLKQFESNKQKAQFEAETVPVPAKSDLMRLALVNALPFIGFGFLDNFTMIIAGDYIEHTLGLFMCISTMAAAALGNTISDVIGIGSAFYVEKVAEMSGVKPPKLTPIQLEMKSSRRAANMGRVIGITIGCILGMCPLLFSKDADKKDDKAVAEAAAAPVDVVVLEKGK